jgi:hypothetical protein
MPADPIAEKSTEFSQSWFGLPKTEAFQRVGSIKLRASD